MDDVLKRIHQLSQSKRLISVDQVIMATVLDLEKLMNPNLPDDSLLDIQNSLLSLFSANDGNFSIQCSLYIGSQFLLSMEYSKNPQIWDLFNLVISNTKFTTIMAAGYVCRHIGSKFKAQLPRLAEHLLKQKSSLDFPVSYCLRAIFKAGGKSMLQYANQAIDFAKKAVTQNRQGTTAECIKLLKAIAKIANAPVHSIIECLRILTKEEQIPFLKNEISALIARCAFAPLFPLLNKKKKEKSEWIIEKIKSETTSELERPLEVLMQFPGYLKMAFPHFINLLTPSLISSNHAILYSFVKKNCPSLINTIVPMFPADARFTYFQEVSKEEPSSSQLRLLNALSPDNDSISEAAGVALLLTCSGDKIAKEEAINFFTNFAKSYPTIILSYLRSSLVLLAQPPDNNPNIERDTIGNAHLAYTIFKNIPHMEDAIEPNKEILTQFFNDVFTSPNFHSPRFSSALLLLSILPPEFSQTPVIKKSIAAAIDILKKEPFNKRLAKALFAFREVNIDYDQNHELISIALNTAESHISMCVLSSLSVLSPLSGSSDSELTSIAQLIIKHSMKISPSAKVMKMFISRPLPTGFDLLKYLNESSLSNQKKQQYLVKIIENIPQLLNAITQSERQNIIDSLLNLKTANSTAHLILLQLCKSNFSMPKSSLSVFLHLLETNNLSVLQIISECISYFLIKNPQLIQTVFNFIEKQKNIASCLLLSSIFTHSNIVGINLISRSLMLLNTLTKNGALLPFAVHAISSMFLTHSMQLTNLGTTLNEFAMIFDNLNTNYSIQPVVLHLCAECFSILVEVSSSDLVQQQSSSNYYLIPLIMRTFDLTPVSYAREAYFECYKSIITFAHNLLMKRDNIKEFPSSIGASHSLQLCACETFCEYFKFNEPINFDYEKTVDLLLNLLQKTSDPSASNFLIVLANTFSKNEKEISFWISIIRRILLANSLFQNIEIEPSAVVKKCFLKVSLTLLPHIIKQKFIKTEFLDDIISSASHSIETNHHELQESAFPVLKTTIDLFRFQKSEEGGRILDIYDSQFSQSVKIGFQLNLAISGSFLSTYLEFITDALTSDLENCSIVLNVYLDGIRGCKQRTPAYYSLATHLCIIAEKYPKIAGMMEDFWVELGEIFNDVFLMAVQLWKNKNDWRKMTKFRDFASSFYSNLLPAFVWLQTKIKNPVIPKEALISFLLIESQNSKEPWMQSGAFSAIPVFLENFGKLLPSNLIQLCLKSSLKTNFLPEIIFNASKILKPNKDHDPIRLSILSLAMSSANDNIKTFNTQLFANIIHSDFESKSLSVYMNCVSKLFLDMFVTQKINDKESISLFTLLFYHSPKLIGSIISKILIRSDIDCDFKFSLLKIAVAVIGKNNSIPIPLRQISRFCIENFKKGGMLLVGKALIENPELGFSLLSQGNAKAAFLLCANDIDNCRAYLRFIQLSLESLIHINNFDTKLSFSTSVFKLSVTILCCFGSDTQRGHQIVSLCIQLFQKIKEIVGVEKLNEMFNSLEIKEKLATFKMINLHISKAVLRKRNQSLSAFSTVQRSRRGGIDIDDDESGWQTLEVGDDSDSF